MTKDRGVDASYQERLEVIFRFLLMKQKKKQIAREMKRNIKFVRRWLKRKDEILSTGQAQSKRKGRVGRKPFFLTQSEWRLQRNWWELFRGLWPRNLVFAERHYAERLGKAQQTHKDHSHTLQRQLLGQRLRLKNKRFSLHLNLLLERLLEELMLDGGAFARKWAISTIRLSVCLEK